MKEPQMSFADAIIILRMWRELKDSDVVVKRQVDDYIRAMLIVYTTRR